MNTDGMSAERATEYGDRICGALAEEGPVDARDALVALASVMMLLLRQLPEDDARGFLTVIVKMYFDGPLADAEVAGHA